MKYNGTIYRPPVEAGVFLVPITEGCTHNSCTFCSMYKDIPFRMLTLDEIREYLDETAARHRKHAASRKRAYLFGGDPFALSAQHLLERIELIREYLPNVQVFTMYARVDNVWTKSDEDLRALAAAGVNDLYIGIECADDEYLDYLNKGFTVAQAEEQCARLVSAGINHSDLFMFGCGGTGNAERAAAANASFENQTRPTQTLCTTLTSYVGTKLEENIRSGVFIPATEKEILQEERRLVELLDVPTYFWATHPLDAVRTEGELPQERDLVLQDLDEGLRLIEGTDIKRTGRTGTL